MTSFEMTALKYNLMEPFQAYPDFQIMDYFVIRTLQSVFQSDASPTQRPMTYYVESPQAISGLFSNIAYAKCKYITDKILKTAQNIKECGPGLMCHCTSYKMAIHAT